MVSLRHKGFQFVALCARLRGGETDLQVSLFFVPGSAERQRAWRNASQCSLGFGTASGVIWLHVRHGLGVADGFQGDMTLSECEHRRRLGRSWRCGTSAETFVSYRWRVVSYSIDLDSKHSSGINQLSPGPFPKTFCVDIIKSS
jgi:hypothetical protein